MNYDSLRKDKMLALKAKDSLKNKVLTSVLSELVYLKKELDREIEEKDIIAIFRKMIKQNEETLALSQNRPEKQEELEAEISFLKTYLPKSLSKEELQVKIEALAELEGIERSMSNKGALMKLAMSELASLSDGKTISELVDAFLKG